MEPLAHLQGDEPVDGEGGKLARDVADTKVGDELRVVERQPPGHCGRASMSGEPRRS